MSKASDKLTELAERGCLIYLTNEELYYHPIRFALKDKALAWVNAFAETQHDVHLLQFDRVDVSGNHVVFIRNGDLVAGVSEFAEYSGPEAETGREDHERFKSAMRRRDFAEPFNSFADQ